MYIITLPFAEDESNILRLFKLTLVISPVFSITESLPSSIMSGVALAGDDEYADVLNILVH